MSKDIIISINGSSTLLQNVDKIETDLYGGGTCTWVPERNGPNNELFYSYELPSTYQEVEYITFSGSQYLTLTYTNLGEVFIKGQDDSTDNYQLWRCVAGYRTSSTSDYDWSAKLPREVPSDYTKYFFSRSYKYNNLTYIQDNGNNSLSTISFVLSPRSTQTTNMYIGKYYSNTETTGSPFIGKLYKAYMQHRNGINGDTEFEWYLVPCYRKSDNVIGMYDVINNSFKTNDGSGSFGKGSDVT